MQPVFQRGPPHMSHLRVLSSPGGGENTPRIQHAQSCHGNSDATAATAEVGASKTLYCSSRARIISSYKTTPKSARVPSTRRNSPIPPRGLEKASRKKLGCVLFSRIIVLKARPGNHHAGQSTRRGCPAGEVARRPKSIEVACPPARLPARPGWRNRGKGILYETENEIESRIAFLRGEEAIFKASCRQPR
jgi:hypothetical protein